MSEFCTYLTTYKGNKLPPFYIGASSVSKVQSGYHGSVVNQKYVRIWNQEVRLNPHLFTTRIIRTYRLRKEAFDAEVRLQRALDVINNPLYVNQGIGGFPPAKPGKENSFFGKKHSDETKAKISKKMKARNFVGGNNPFYGKKHSDDTKQKISKTSKGPKHTREKRKYWSKTRRGEKNGFFGKTHSSELKAIWKSTRHLARWYHNGEKSILRINDPGEGWTLGRLPTAKS